MFGLPACTSLWLYCSLDNLWVCFLPAFETTHFTLHPLKYTDKILNKNKLEKSFAWWHHHLSPLPPCSLLSDSAVQNNLSFAIPGFAGQTQQWGYNKFLIPELQLLLFFFFQISLYIFHTILVLSHTLLSSMILLILAMKYPFLLLLCYFFYWTTYCLILSIPQDDLFLHVIYNDSYAEHIFSECYPWDTMHPGIWICFYNIISFLFLSLMVLLMPSKF